MQIGADKFLPRSAVEFPPDKKMPYFRKKAMEFFPPACYIV